MIKIDKIYKKYFKKYRPIIDSLNQVPLVNFIIQYLLLKVDNYYSRKYCGIDADLKSHGFNLSNNSFGNKILYFVNAFNNEVLIKTSISMFKKHATKDDLLIVTDNSQNLEKREIIKNICSSEGIYYVPLPENPRTQPNLNHGLALNYTYYQIVKKLKPFAFGFIDHDIFPTKKLDIKNKLMNSSMYGWKLDYRHKKYPWFGAFYLSVCFSFFKYDYVKDMQLNFMPTVILRWNMVTGLDTGGGNYKILYSKDNLKDILFAKHTKNPNGTEWLDDWIHLSHCFIRSPEEINSMINDIVQPIKK